MITEKIMTLEQTVMQRLRWAAGANPLVQEVLVKFERRQKERTNEIDVSVNSLFLIKTNVQSFRMIKISVPNWFKFFNPGYFLNSMKNRLNYNKI